MIDGRLVFTSLDNALRELDRLAKALVEIPTNELQKATGKQVLHATGHDQECSFG